MHCMVILTIRKNGEEEALNTHPRTTHLMRGTVLFLKARPGDWIVVILCISRKAGPVETLKSRLYDSWNIKPVIGLTHRVSDRTELPEVHIHLNGHVHGLTT